MDPSQGNAPIGQSPDTHTNGSSGFIKVRQPRVANNEPTNASAQLDSSAIEAVNNTGAITSSVSSETNISNFERPSMSGFSKKAFLISVSSVILITFIGGVTLWLLGRHTNNQLNQGTTANNYSPQSISIGKVKSSYGQLLGGAQSLDINGKLLVGNTIILSPTSAPANPSVGQIYYSSSTNEPYYYNGSNFVSFVPQQTIQQTTSASTCAYGSCLSLQPNSPGTVQAGSINISGSILAGDLTVKDSVSAATISSVGVIDTTTGYDINGVPLSSSSLSDSGNIAHLNQSQTFTGSNAFTGSNTFAGANTFSGGATFTGSTIVLRNSLTAFQIQNSNGQSLLNADTQNSQLSINASTTSIQTPDNSTSAFEVQDANGVSVVQVNTTQDGLTVSGYPTNSMSANLITDDNFSDSNWTTDEYNAGSWSLGSNSATFTATKGYSSGDLMTNQFPTQSNDEYAFSFTLTNASANACVDFMVGGDYYTDYCGDGTYSGYIVAGNSSGLDIYIYDGTATISYISVNKVDYDNTALTVEATPSVSTTTISPVNLSPSQDFTSNADWVAYPSSDWTLTTNSATYGNSGNDYLEDLQVNLNTANQYQVSFTLSNTTDSGYIAFEDSEQNGLAYIYVSGNGTYTADLSNIQINSPLYIYIDPFGGGSFQGGTISNVTVNQVSSAAYNPAAIIVGNSSGGENLEITAPNYSSVYIGNQSGSTASGVGNTSLGSFSSYNLTTGSSNTASGDNALYYNTSGSDNTALGNGALSNNATGSGNTALGYGAEVLTSSLQNSTAIGIDSEVGENNALVLGCVSGLNGCSTTTSVGIGTLTPSATLNVVGTSMFQGSLTATSGVNTSLVSGGASSPTNYASVVLNTSGLQSYWRLGETSGSMIDQKGGISGTVDNLSGCSGTHYVRGVTGGISSAAGDDGAFQINKDSCYGNGAAYVDLGNNYGFTGTTPFSIEAWVNIPQGAADDTNETIISKAANMPYNSSAGGWGLYDLGGELIFGRGNSTGYYDEAYMDSMPSGWNYVVGTYDGTTMDLYDNGQLVSSIPSSVAVGSNTTNLLLGHQGGDYYTGMVGSVDETAIYNQALTPSEIASHYDLGTSSVPTGNLKLTSNSTSTKGSIYFGSSSAYDETQGWLGVGTTSPANLLSVGALTTAAGTYQIAVSTNGVTNSGIVVQDVASQTGGYAYTLQSSLGATLADIDYQGNLSVQSANVSGILTVNGHLVTSNASGTTQAAVQANAGSTATCTLTGDDTSGKVTITSSGTGQASGDQCLISFSSTYASSTNPVMTNTSSNDSTVSMYLAPSDSGFVIDFGVAPTSGEIYTFDYFNAQ